jgi:uncharacterized protein YukE
MLEEEKNNGFKELNFELNQLSDVIQNLRDEVENIQNRVMEKEILLEQIFNMIEEQ